MTRKKYNRPVATIQELENQIFELEDYVRRVQPPLRIALRQIGRLKERIRRRKKHPNRVDVVEKSMAKTDSC